MAASAVKTDRELVISRTFDAPCAVVFEAWTNPKHLVHWWGPFGFTTTIQQMDVRPGGEWRLVMRGPDGRDYRNRIIFIQVVRPRLLVYRHEPEPGTEPVTHETTVTFEPEGERTRLTMRMVFESPEGLAHVIKTYKADEGGRQTLQRLADHLAESAKKTVVINRIFNAPPALLWKLWTDPKHVALWWGPNGFSNPVCEWDARLSGKIRIEMKGPDGNIHPMTGEFIEVRELERIAFRAAVAGRLEVENTATFTAQPDGNTLLTLEARVVSATDEGMINLAGMEMGWTQSIERLAVEVHSLCS